MPDVVHWFQQLALSADVAALTRQAAAIIDGGSGLNRFCAQAISAALRWLARWPLLVVLVARQNLSEIVQDDVQVSRRGRRSLQGRVNDAPTDLDRGVIAHIVGSLED